MLFVLFIFYLSFYYAYSVCTAPTPYLLVSNSTCFAECPWNPPQLYYASPSTNTCVTTCPSTWYGFDGNKTCVQTCPSTPNMTFYDTVNSKCVTLCPANYYSYLGAAAVNQQCVSTCPTGTFAQQTKRQCVSSCPSNTFYKNDSTPYCVLRCPDNYYASPIDKNCKLGGSCPTAPVRYFSDDTTNLCVQKCPNNTYADVTTGRCLIYCSSGYFADKTTWKCVQNCPSDYYRSNVTRSCILTCTQGYFIDKLTGNCTQTCTAATYGDFATGFCQQQCTNSTFSDATLGRCVNICSFGLYADNFTQSCVSQLNCYSNWVGDPTTRKCVEASKCPTTPYHYANLVSKICVLKCPSPLWGDKSTKTCVSICPWNPKTYVSWKNPDNNECVTKCPQFPMLYADNYTQTCVSVCPAQNVTVAYDTFADDLSQSCVRVCSNGFKSQKPEYICISECSNNPTILYFYPIDSTCVTGCPQGYFSDLSRQLCTQKCPSNPDYFALDSNNTCVDVCPSGLYADSSTRKCVQWCPETTLQYADDSTNQCVDVCPITPDYFGLDRIDGNKVCVTTCDVGLFADPLTRTCIPKCNMQEGYYGQFINPLRRCILECPPLFYADNVTGTCVSKCPSFPFIYYGNPKTKKCELNCPQFLYGNSVTNVCGLPTNCEIGLFADDFTNKCVKTCPITDLTFGQSTSRRCLKSCPEGKFADNTTRMCSNTCNTTAKLYQDPSTNQCVKTCPTIPNLYNDPYTMKCQQRCNNNWFAYDQGRKCVQICPSSPALYGNIVTYRCVQACPPQSYKYVSNTQRSCLPNCPPINLGTMRDLYADNTTWSCVSVCPQSANLYSFKHPDFTTIRTCVLTCPVINDTAFYFADNMTQSCVSTCPLKNLTWGDTFTLKCSKDCTRNQYRDNGTVRCTYACSSPYFSDNTTWNCVKECPKGLFAFALGTNRTCLRQCPTGTYADNSTKFCRSLCDNDVALWSDNTTWACVTTCPSVPDMYADPNSDKCQFACSNGLYADKFKRKCVTALQCSTGTIGDPTIYRCVTKCPIEIPRFWQVSSNTCVTRCQDSFYADNSTMKCVPTCSSSPDFYAYNDTTLGPVCVLLCPATFYKHLPNRTCCTACPAPNYFKDSTTMKCVQTCPDYYFAQTIDQICVVNCSVNSKFGLNNICYPSCTGIYSNDPTTYLCVKECPFTYFSEQNVCTQTCNIGYADKITKKCQPILCSPGYYIQKGTHLCVQDCQPEYKYDLNQTCLTTCPQTSNYSTNLYMDNNSYMCNNTCLPGWYADNNTGFCNTQCSNGLFSDNSTGRCVNKCPSTPDYFGYQKVCYFPCPNTGLYAQNITRQCLTTCPTGGFADDYNQRCMDVCTLKQYSHTYVSLSITYNVCLDMCPQGFYAADNTKSCVPICPETTYGQNVTNKCLQKCPTGTYADQYLNLCVLQCDFGRAQFKDWSSNRCVTNCPLIPSLFAQNSSRSCVAFCSASWYGLNTTRTCRQSCPSPFYADPSTGFCQVKCYIGANRFADDISRSCVLNCPNYTDPITNKFVITYEDNSTKKCVNQCPFFPSLYGYNTTNQCVEDCPGGTFGDNDTRLCHDKCFFDVLFNGVKKYTFADPTTGFCLKQCPKTYFSDNKTVTCTQYCSQGTFADNSTWRCVFMCPNNPVSYAKLSTRQCVYRCDNGYFGDELSRKCLNYCPKQPSYYYKDYQNQRCVKNCTTQDNQYFAEDLSQSCVTVCTVGYFKSLSQHACVKCPSSCLTCIALLNCTSCLQGLYLYEGECIESCPTFPVRFYANDLSSACTAQCPIPYFGFNGTGKCQLKCPQKYYSDITDNTCKTCNVGCRNCTSLNMCLDCLVGYVYVSQYYTCSKICNSTHTFFVQGVCSKQCVAGTFLLSDLVTCQKCSTQCATCSISGKNCTKCASKFWYNYNCVDQCPKNFYADKNNTCLDCQNNADACAVQPLRFTIETFTKQYKLYAYVKFNRAVNITLDQFNKIVVIKTSKGPVKSSSYKASVYDIKTYLIEFLDSTSLNQLSLSIGFTPGSIVDQFGNGLVDSSQDMKIQTITTISTKTKQTAVQMKSNVNVISWILIVLLIVMMIKCSYPLIVLIDFLQILYIHLFIYIDPLPYLWMHFMSALENVNFTFLPKLFTEQNETSFNPYNQFKKDITFLGNMQPVIFIAILFGLTYLLFWGVSISKIKLFKCLRRPMKKIFKNRMRFSFFNEIFYYTQIYVVYFAVTQWPSNKSQTNPIANLALSILFVGFYVAWLVFLLYKTSHYKDSLTSMPKRFKFLVMEPTKFPLDIAMRYLLKLCFCLCLIISQKTVQIIFLIVINLVYFLFNLIYKPAIDSKTNYMNMLVSLGFIAYEILLFVYGISTKTSAQQQTWSYALIAVAGIMLGFILIWMFYRLVAYIRVQFLGIGVKNQQIYEQNENINRDKQIQDTQSNKNQNVFSFFNWNKLKSTKKTSKAIKSHYDKLNSLSKSMIDEDQKSVKNMLPELQFNIKDQEDDSQPEINEEQIMNEFAYHMVPRKHEAVIKAQKQIFAKKGLEGKDRKSKKRSVPMIISIDQDQLIDRNIQIIDSKLNHTLTGKQQKSKQQQERIKDKPLNDKKQPPTKPTSQLKKQQSRIKSSKRQQNGNNNNVIWKRNLAYESQNDDIDNIISVVNSNAQLQE